MWTRIRWLKQADCGCQRCSPWSLPPPLSALEEARCAPFQIHPWGSQSIGTGKLSLRLCCRIQFSVVLASRQLQLTASPGSAWLRLYLWMTSAFPRVRAILVSWGSVTTACVALWRQYGRHSNKDLSCRHPLHLFHGCSIQITGCRFAHRLTVSAATLTTTFMTNAGSTRNFPAL